MEKVTQLNILKIAVILSVISFDGHPPSSLHIPSGWHRCTRGEGENTASLEESERPTLGCPVWLSHGKGQTPSLPDVHGLILAQSRDFFINPQVGKH